MWGSVPFSVRLNPRGLSFRGAQQGIFSFHSDPRFEGPRRVSDDTCFTPVFCCRLNFCFLVLSFRHRI
jgi:hypothetical protein